MSIPFFLFLVFTHLLLSRMGVKVKRKANLVKFWASCHIQPRSMDYCLCPPPPTRLYFACIYLRGTGSVDSAITGFRPQSCSGTVRAGFTNSHLLRDTGCVSDSHLFCCKSFLCNITMQYSPLILAIVLSLHSSLFIISYVLYSCRK